MKSLIALALILWVGLQVTGSPGMSLVGSDGLHAAGAARLREKHRSELAGADKADPDRVAGEMARYARSFAPDLNSGQPAGQTGDHLDEMFASFIRAELVGRPVVEMLECGERFDRATRFCGDAI